MARTLPTNIQEWAEEIGRIIGAGLAILIGSIIVGKVTLIGPIEEANFWLFDPLVDGLSAVPGVVSVSEWLTDMGKLSWNQIMVVVLAIAAAVMRKPPAFAVALLVVAAGLRSFQSVIARTVDSSAPSGADVIGTAGPYFSGGVFRVVVIAGLAVAIFGMARRQTYAVATFFGVLEGITRMALGRHWPFDILAAIPIGLGVLWCLLRLLDVLEGSRQASRAGEEKLLV